MTMTCYILYIYGIWSPTFNFDYLFYNCFQYSRFLCFKTTCINRLIKSMKYEAEIHRQLRHPNIVSMLGAVFEECHYGIILEFVTYGSWTDFINNIRDDPGRFNIQ